MQADVEMLRRQRSDLEDQELEVMEARETLDAEIEASPRRSSAARPTPRSSACAGLIAVAEGEIDAELAAEDDGVGRAQAAAMPGVVARRLPTTPGAEQGRGRGPPRGHVVHRVPPVDPVDRSRADPQGRRRLGRVLRQLRRHPRSVTQVEPAVRGRRPQGRRAAPYCDGGSRGNPGPAAIGAVVFDASTDRRSWSPR